MSPAVHHLVRSLPPVAHHVDLAQLGQLSSKTSAERLPVAQHVERLEHHVDNLVCQPNVS
jgi:hypothetical protein